MLTSLNPKYSTEILIYYLRVCCTFLLFVEVRNHLEKGNRQLPGKIRRHSITRTMELILETHDRLVTYQAPKDSLKSLDYHFMDYDKNVQERHKVC